MPELVVMLIHNDVTVPDAVETSLMCKDLPVKYWEFKDHGMRPDKMKELTQCMKDNGKTIFLEAVSHVEAECMCGAKLAVECRSDYLIGTIFYDSTSEYIKTTDLRYCLFAGTVAQNPGILQGAVQEMLDQEAMSTEKGCMGIDLLGYRYVDGGPAVLSVEYVAKVKKPTILADSIGNDERVAEVLKVNPWMLIMGSALLAKKFVGNGNLCQDLGYVLGLLK